MSEFNKEPDGYIGLRRKQGEWSMNDIANQAPGSNTGTTEEFFCVIGTSVTENHPIKRTWRKTQEAAARHAEKLIADSQNGSTFRTKKLLVVKVVEVVEVPVPTLIRRKVVSGEDVGLQTQEDE